MVDRQMLPKDRINHLRGLEDMLSYTFNDIALLHNALTHKSFANENQELEYDDNERLEFLGDAVLGLCVSDLLMKQYPDYPEGRLSKLRASVVNEQPLVKLAEKFRISNFILVGKGEEASGGRYKPSIMANTVEAIIAAIYLDGGYGTVLSFIKTVFRPLIDEWIEEPVYYDYKTAVQEYSQSRHKVIPRYTLIHEYGPDHDKIFQARLTITNVVMTTGIGRSKKEAEQEAARKALEELARSEERDVKETD